MESSYDLSPEYNSVIWPISLRLIGGHLNDPEARFTEVSMEVIGKHLSRDIEMIQVGKARAKKSLWVIAVNIQEK